MDVWVTGFAVLLVALGNGHAFLALIATYKSTEVLKQLSLMPVSPVQLIVGEVIPRAVMGMLTVLLVLVIGRALGASVRIGPELLGVVPVMALITAVGLSVAFVIAGLTKSPQDANALDSYVSFPLYLFTGAMLPLAAFPDWLQQIAQFIPYTALIATVRGVALAGQPLTGFGPELAVAGVWVALLLLAATRAYRLPAPAWTSSTSWSPDLPSCCRSAASRTRRSPSPPATRRAASSAAWPPPRSRRPASSRPRS
jgi:ABC-type multidrug transport system permease subunit